MNNIERFAKAIQWQPVDRLMTYDFIDNQEILIKHGGYDPAKDYEYDHIIEMNAKAFKSIGLNATRYIYDPKNHWMGSKIQKWIRFFGVDPDSWEVTQAGDTAWISKRPFHTLQELEKHMPRIPKYEEVAEWYTPWIKRVKEIFDAYDVVFIGAAEGPFSDAYSYMEMDLFSMALYQAPELVAQVLDCAGLFSSYIARAFAENASAPLMFMGEDICGVNGPIFSPALIRSEGVPRWKWISDPIHSKGMKFLFHTDGRVRDLLPTIFNEFHADGFNPIERNELNNIFEIRAQYPEKMLFGNVCCMHTLPKGTPQDVEDETLELIEKLGPHGGIFIGSSSEVHDKVPLVNAETMYRIVQEYGEYPIDVDRIRRRRREIRQTRR